ncbi:gluconate 2-dehydrogenase subunit 3 family protein [Microvirga puerhi]|uniref:Gluconate 2-dehydrogenase subunit 3 family protein n=1 Tax=Microvirga puerhi TaxID=2876078 RepID=A0ABS7VJJ4_9HYPH|nr:gluconate 2-dehydrogenase subunit 3 family protein [Microvirga puerhi]MBZ6075694.1 gluconate 2-dehydrogenase subunit 3 family protein [Microvirga puerhi]
MRLRRRDFLLTTAAILGGSHIALADSISGSLPWEPDAGIPPERIKLGSWLYFTSEEARTVEALADRIIPPDPATPGGKDAGCAVYLDRQLAGPYGSQHGLYVKPPFLKGLKQQGPQTEDGPAQVYRKGLAALNRYSSQGQDGKVFAELTGERQDEILKGLESGKLQLPEADGQAFFEALLKDIQQGFFADPIYGGNRDMVAWRMIGFPGARYNYRDWVNRHNERYPLPPVGITGRPEWTPKKS